MQKRNSSNLKGIDVSHHQGIIDWAKVKQSGISFAFIKATEGQRFNDPMFAQNVKGALAAGIEVGAYHFCRAKTVEAAKLEADHFIQIVQSIGGFGIFKLPPVLDIETPEGETKANITAICRAWVDKVKPFAQPIIYTYLTFAKNYLDKSLADIPLWFARYDKEQPEDVSGWTEWAFLQYSNKGTVPGIAGRVDLNEKQIVTKKGDVTMKVAEWAQPGLEFVKAKGISDGERPTDKITRQEVWQMLLKMQLAQDEQNTKITNELRMRIHELEKQLSKV